MPLEDALPNYLKGVSDASAAGVLPLIGFVNRGVKEGEWRLYTGLDMSRCLEITETDILDFERLSPEESPFGKLGGTRVLVRKNADVRSNRMSAQQQSADEFDLDVRIAAGHITPKDICEGTEDGTTCAAECEGETDGCGTDACTEGCPHRTDNTCKTECGPTCNDAKTCVTCNQATCHTCATKCNQNTCHTCATQCNQNTCAQTCNQATCHTCATKCNQATCHTCQTKCGGETCVACTHVTCGHQPGCIAV